MSKDVLKDHYERKYAYEKDAKQIETINITAKPVTRFEAAVKYFPEYFSGGDVLELGAGNGNVAKSLLLSESKINTYTLGDISTARLEGIGNNLNDPRVRLIQLDAENIPESEYGKYDAVIMIALIEHLIDPLNSMMKVHRLLKTGGFVYIDTPNIAKYTQRIKLLSGRFPSTASKNEGLTTHSGEPADLYDEGHLHYFTYRSLSLMLTERCNFSKVVKLAYPGGRTVCGKYIHTYLARLWPEMFSELVIIAYR